MAKLFAAHLVQKTSADFVGGEYDPEQELWVADNQLQGATPFLTITGTRTQTKQGTGTNTTHVTGFVLDLDHDLDTRIVPDTDNDPDV